VAIAVDTGVMLSAADTDEPRHTECAEILRRHHGELLIPAPAVAETAWMIESRLGPAAEGRFLRLITNGELSVIDLTLDDYSRCVQLIETYAEMGLGLVDASMVTIAERFRIDTITALNRRDFSVVRPRHVEAFELLP
jgi:predicted nucleic acid-binding protein